MGLILYRFRITFRARWRGYLSLVLLVGVVGGLSMASLAGARRTQGAYGRYLASTDPSSLQVTVFGGANNGGGDPAVYSRKAVAAIAALPGVRHVETATLLFMLPLDAHGAPEIDTLAQVQPIDSVDGLFYQQNRVTVVAGRRADPRRADEVMMTATAAAALHVHVGEVVPFGLYAESQGADPGFGTASVAPHRRIDARVVGLIQMSNAVVQDDIDRYPTFAVWTPALAREILADDGQGQAGALTYGLQVAGGDRGVAAVEREFAAVAPAGNSFGFHAFAPVVAKVSRVVKPIDIALAVFGAIAAGATLLITVQLISRELQRTDLERDVLRSLGGGPLAVIADGLVGLLGSIAAGAALAVVVAVALSPLAPLGPVRSVYPSRGVAVDGAVLGIGAAALFVVLGATAAALSHRHAPHVRGRRIVTPRSSRVVESLASAGLPAPGVIGVRFAVEPSRGRAPVPVRSALVGAVVTVAVTVATLTFGASLRSLVAHPTLYGWNFSYLLNASNNTPPEVLHRLDADQQVAAWEGYDYGVADIDGLTLPFLIDAGGSSTKPSISPPVLSGRAVQSGHDVVVGPATLAQLHKHLGDTVEVSYGQLAGQASLPPVRLVIVGTATMPAVGFSSVIDDHTTMGTGVIVSLQATPPSLRPSLQSPDPTLDGPNLVFVKLRRGVAPGAGVSGLRRIAASAAPVFAAIPDAAGDSLAVQSVQRPAEIVNYRSMGNTPSLFAGALAAGAVVAVGLTLAASVRARRRDLALLKALGFTRRQLATAVAWQASVAALVGIVVGLPLGIASGRWLWTLFARQINAVPTPSVPVLSMVLVVVGALVLANVVAALPGRNAGRTSTAVLLRAE